MLVVDATVDNMITNILFNKWTHFALAILCAYDAFSMAGVIARLANLISAGLLLAVWLSVSRKKFSNT